MFPPFVPLLHSRVHCVSIAIAVGLLGLNGVKKLHGDELDYSKNIKPILAKYCVGCHNDIDNESDVYLQSLSDIVRSRTTKPIVVPKHSKDSLLVQVLRGGEPSMPPADSPKPSNDEIELIARWIDLGMPGSDERLPLKAMLRSRPSKYKAAGTSSIASIGFAGSNRLLIGQYGAVSIANGQWKNTLPIEIIGKVNQIRANASGRFSAIACGIPGAGGQAIVLENIEGSSVPKLVRVIEGHLDSIYTSVVSPDGTKLATAGYDRVIMLWDVPSGKLLRRFEGHNGAIYDLDFDSTGNILASASADETIKVWRTDSGERLDTFGQCEAEQYSVRFASDNQRIVAAGADRRIRVWKLLSFDKPSVSPMLNSVFAHEAPVTYIALSKDGRFLATGSEDKSIKLWNASDISLLGKVLTLSDCPSGLLWSDNGSHLTVSSSSGALEHVDASQWTKQPNLTRRPIESQESENLKGREQIVPVEISEMDGVHTLSNPQLITGPCIVNASLKNRDMQGDLAGDWYEFTSKANTPWVIEVNASRSGSPMDSLIEVLSDRGTPILRTKLQAVRETYFTFRGKDSSNSDDFRLHRWEDMELNELLYAGGEVVKLWHYPRGPDSGFKTYPGFGNRVTYFDTTATTHALNEPAWIVRELPESAAPVLNGLPVFPIYYSNDDDSNRQLGKDSKLTFVPKAEGIFKIRVRDARGQSGDNYSYKLLLTSPNPRFNFRVEQKEISLRPGVGTEFGVAVDRFDGCDGEVDVQVEGLPDGFQSTPLTIEAGQNRALGCIQSPADASTRTMEFKLKLSATSKLGEQTLVGNEAQEIVVKVSDKPAMRFKMVDKSQPDDAPALTELTIRPGETISAKLVIERGELQGDIPFGFDDSGRNLPHGCYVDNIGLSGLLIPAGQSTREVFITASPVTRPQTRLFHIRANTDGNPTSAPIRIRVVE